jgi:hypothetical protein
MILSEKKDEDKNEKTFEKKLIFLLPHRRKSSLKI